MRKLSLLLVLTVVMSACADPDPVGGGVLATTTTVDPEHPVDSDGDEPATPGTPGTVGSVPMPRPPIDGNIDGEVWIASTDLRVMESYPIQVMLDVSGEKPTPCHEIFWTVEDSSGIIEIEMISQIAPEEACAQVVEPFRIAVPLGSWEGAHRQVKLNGDVVGSFES